MTKHVIYLEPVPGKWHLKGGYLGGNYPVNKPIYGRVSRDEADTFSRGEAVRRALEISDKGYPCRCEPPITLTL